VAVIEGAGGLLTPLGQDFNARDLIAALRAWPLLVCPNRLGAVNQTLLTLDALPRAAAARTRVVLVAPERPDASTASNRSLLGEFIPLHRIISLPRLRDPFAARASAHPGVRRALRCLDRSSVPHGGA
jgi:dethiobiotin synthetase